MDLPWSWFMDDWSGWCDWSWSGWDNLEASALVGPPVQPVPKRHREVPKKTNLKETSATWWYCTWLPKKILNSICAGKFHGCCVFNGKGVVLWGVLNLM